MQGVIPIIITYEDNSSFAYDSFIPIDSVFIPSLSSLSNKYMAVVVQWLERAVVVRKTGVRLSPPAFNFENINLGANGTIGADCPHSF